MTSRITDPRTLGNCPQAPYPDKFTFNMDWFIKPSDDPNSVELVRDPNIKPLPSFPDLEEDLEGRILLKLEDNVSTDLIMPAGNRVLPLRSNIPAMSDYAFDIADPTIPIPLSGRKL